MEGEALTAARALLPLIAKLRDETENGRRLPPQLVDALRAAGLCRRAMPPLEALDVYELLAGAEASVAWIVWNNALPCFFGRFLPVESREEIFGNADWLYASSTRPSGRAALEGDHYRVNGRWSLVSGCELAEWLALRCAIEENGQPRMLAPQVPEVRMMWVRRRDVEILDTWHTGGLRGTGSHDVVLADLVVPRRHSISPLDGSSVPGARGRVPIVCNMAAGYGAQLLGMAQAAIETLITLSGTKAVVDPGPPIAERPQVLAAIAEHRNRVAAARGHLHARVAGLWAAAEAGRASREQIAAVFGAAHHAMAEGRATVSALYALAGASALYTSSPLERAHRDMHAMAAHVIAQRLWLEDTGRVMLGREPLNPMYLV